MNILGSYARLPLRGSAPVVLLYVAASWGSVSACTAEMADVGYDEGLEPFEDELAVTDDVAAAEEALVTYTGPMSNKTTKHCVDVPLTLGARVRTRACSGSASQTLALDNLSSGAVTFVTQIRRRGSDRCLEASGSSVRVARCDSNKLSQQWGRWLLPPWLVVNMATGKYLNVSAPNASLTLGTSCVNCYWVSGI